MKKTLLTFILFYATTAFAQTAFINGYVVLNTNDTLRGYLKQDVEENYLAHISFSNNTQGSSSHEYLPTDIKSFAFDDGNTFESIQFIDDGNSQVTYFAKYLLRGYYNLYTFRKKDLQYFLVKQDDKVYFLYDDIITSSGIYNTKGNYKNILLFLSQSCKKMADQISNARYAGSDLISFISKLNDCIAPENKSTVVEVQSKTLTRIYVYAGGLPLSDKYEFTGRVLARFSKPSISKNLFLNAGVSYLAHKETETLYGVKKDHVTNILSAALTLQNNFTTGIIQPYLEAGFGFSYKQETNTVIRGSGFQNKYGIDFIIAAGIEGFVTKNLAIKADCRYELLFHYPTIGIAYFF
jgi:hypothetical protein